MATRNDHTPLTSPPTLPIASVKLLLLLVGHLPLYHASPLFFSASQARASEEEPLPAQDAALWIYLAVAAALVLIGGAFAGLTIALMGQVKLPAIFGVKLC